MKKESPDSTEKILSHKLFLQREYSVSHLPYERELNFYNAVKNGDIKTLKEIMLPLKNEQLGTLSENPLRNMKYHLIITVALITRFCIEGGLPAETAYTLSDIYIQQLDLCKKEDEITDLHQKIVFEYANRMKKLKKKNQLSVPVTRTMDYIYDHLQEKIQLEQLARITNLNKSYLCTLFKKETGITIASYINQRRIEAAANMLVYGNFTPQEISSYFAFSSHSHFISCFKKEMGITPTEYKKQHYRRHFDEKVPGLIQE